MDLFSHDLLTLGSASEGARREVTRIEVVLVTEGSVSREVHLWVIILPSVYPSDMLRIAVHVELLVYVPEGVVGGTVLKLGALVIPRRAFYICPPIIALHRRLVTQRHTQRSSKE